MPARCPAPAAPQVLAVLLIAEVGIVLLLDVVPAACGRSHSRHASPHVASLVQTVTAGLLMAICAVAGLDPVLEVFTWLAGVATVGIVALMLLTCLAVLVFFRRMRDPRAWQTVIAPALGLIGLAGCLYLFVANLPLLMGGSTPLGVGAGVLLVVALLAGPVLARLRPTVALDLAAASRSDAAPQI